MSTLSQIVTWIPVADRLPDGGIMLPLATRLGRIEYGWLDLCEFSKRKEKKWQLPYRRHALDYVTHWDERLKHPSEL